MSLNHVGPVADFPPHDEAELPVPDLDSEYRTDALVIGQTRRNQLLPLDWAHLSKVDLFEIRKMLERDLSLPSILEPEAKLAIAAILTTGRKLKDLRRLKLVQREADLDLPGESSEGLIWNDQKRCWRFIAGTSAANIKKRVDASAKRLGKRSKRAKSAAPAPEFVYILVAVDELVQNCILKFPDRFSPLLRAKSGPAPLFTSRKKILTDKILRLLDTRRSPEGGRPRASSRTIASLERFLTRAMTHEYGGDLVGAMRLTGREESVGRTPNYYGETLVRNSVATAKRASAILRGESSRDFDSSKISTPANDERSGDEGNRTWERKSDSVQTVADDQKIGSSLAPVWAEVRGLAEACRKFIVQSAKDPLLAHKALTYQTVALVSFAIGHRGMGEALPASSAIDPITGFCKLHDKMRDHADQARMVWVPEVARKQIRAYELHLETLGNLIEESEFEALLETAREGRLPLFTIDDGIPEPMRYRTLWENLSEEFNLWRPLSPNAGRHWLRSALSGRCSSDTVNAFFGHWLTGGEPWSFGSCLDPLLYRSELNGVLTPLLQKIGWRARNSEGKIV